MLFRNSREEREGLAYSLLKPCFYGKKRLFNLGISWQQANQLAEPARTQQQPWAPKWWQRGRKLRLSNQSSEIKREVVWRIIALLLRVVNASQILGATPPNPSKTAQINALRDSHGWQLVSFYGCRSIAEVAECNQRNGSPWNRLHSKHLPSLNIF